MSVAFVRAESKPTALSVTDNATWDRSLDVWEVRYGGVNESQDHTLLAYFGLIPVDYLGNLAYVWLLPVNYPSPPTMRTLRAAFASFLGFGIWRVIAFTRKEELRNTRFARFMGFTAFAEDAEHFYFKRDV